MRRRFALLGAMAALAVAGASVRAQGMPADAIVARVNGEPVLLSQLRTAAIDQQVPLDPSFGVDYASEGFRRALTQHVDETLLVQKALRDDLRVDPGELTADVDRLLQSVRDRMGGAEAFEKWLREHRLSLDSLKAVLTERERRRNLAVQAIARGVHLDGAALATFERRRRESGEPLEEVNLAQILVRCPAEKQQTEEGRELYQQALYAAREAGKNPERFRQYVAGFSDDPAGRVRGGLLGWLDPQTLREELRERVATMKAGDISAPVAGAEGFHVLFLLDRRSMRDLAFAEAFAAHREQLAMQLREDARLHFYDLRGRPVQLPILPPMMDALQPDGAEDAGSATARPPRPAMPGLLEP